MAYEYEAGSVFRVELLHQQGLVDVTVLKYVTRSLHAVVLKGRVDTEEATVVALKLPIITSDAHRELLEREMAVWSRAQHRHVLPLLATYDDGTQPILVSPWIEHGNLVSYLFDHRDANRRELVLQVAEGLRYLHDDLGIVHGDVKCENVLVSDSHEALLADFGLSTAIEKAANEAPTKTDIRIRSSVPFSAPELLKDKVYDGVKGSQPRKRSKAVATDVYAYGGLVLQAFTNAPPWHAIRNEAQMHTLIMSGMKPSRPADDSPAVRRGLDDQIWNICFRCWEYNPSDRPSMADIVRAYDGSMLPEPAFATSDLIRSDSFSDIGFLTIRRATTGEIKADAEVRAPLVSTASCDACRRKKLKCDLVRPASGVCSTCATSGEECKWTLPQHTAQALSSPPSSSDHLEVPRPAKHKRTPSSMSADFRTTLMDSDDPVRTPNEARQSLNALKSSSPPSSNSRLSPRSLSVRSSMSRSSGPPPVVNLPYDFDLSSPLGSPTAFNHRTELSLEIDWDRHLPDELKVSPALTRDEHDKLLQRFFDYSAPWNLRVIREYFISDMRAALSPANRESRAQYAHYSPALHNIILAEAAAFSSDIVALSSSRVRALVDRASASDYEGSPIAIVQTLAALSHYHMTLRGMTEAAEYWLEKAVNYAQKNAGLCRLDALQDGGRDQSWCYYSIFLQDIQIAFALKGTPKIPPHHHLKIAIIKPLGNDQIMTSLFEFCVNLCKIGRAILHCVSFDTASASDRAQLHSQLKAWYQALPPVLHKKTSVENPHVIVLHVVHSWYVIRLHHASVGKDDESRKHVQNAINRIARLLNEYKRHQSLALSPLVLAQATEESGWAALTLDATAGTHTQASQRKLWLDQAQSFCDDLDQMGRTWECATEYVDRLNVPLAEARSRHNSRDYHLETTAETDCASNLSSSLLSAQLSGLTITTTFHDDNAPSSQSPDNDHHALVIGWITGRDRGELDCPPESLGVVRADVLGGDNVADDGSTTVVHEATDEPEQNLLGR